MKFRYRENPNTVKFWDGYYNARKVERKSGWLFDEVIKCLEIYDRPVALEVGCGAGRTIIELWKRRKDVSWHGIDYSAKAIGKAKVKFGTRGHFLCVDIDHMIKGIDTISPYYDFILCSETLEHLSDPAGACKVMWKMLNDMGTIFITVPVAGTPLDKNPQNLHMVTFEEGDFEELFPEGRVQTFEIDKHHLAVSITKGRVSNGKH